MPPRPAPDLDRRRGDLVRVARRIAETEGWDAVTMRRVATEIGATQPVVYSAFASRQALVDAVAVSGFSDLADSLAATPASPIDRSRAYLEFAVVHPRVYEVMFLRRTDLPFATPEAPAPLRAAFAALREGLAGAGDTEVEAVWAALHGLASLSAAGRLQRGAGERRVSVLQRMIVPLLRETRRADPDGDGHGGDAAT